jgi:hypothetical protein
MGRTLLGGTSVAALVVAGVLVPPVTPTAVAAGPVVCSATFTGTRTTSGPTIGGIVYVVENITVGGTFTPNQALRADYLLVGGGGGGGGGRGNNQANRGAGGGGGSGRVLSGTVTIPASAVTITVGAAGSAGSATAVGGTGGTSSIGALATAAGGGGGGAPGATNPNGANGASGGGGGGDDTQSGSGGTASAGNAGGTGLFNATGTNRVGGGGGGPGSAGGNASGTVGGNGGSGTANSITGSSVTYGGGGGGGGATAGTGGSGNGGNGSTNGVASSGVANTGGGGGGARSTTTTARAGGAGGTGRVIIRYPKFCRNPSAPTSPSLSAPTLSWAAPTFMPSGSSLSSYTVTYTDVTASGDIAVYARGSTATSINVTGTTVGACTSNNPGWTCALTWGSMVSGHTYAFRVFARSSANELGQQTSSFNYVVP